MSAPGIPPSAADFSLLTPDVVMECVETALDTRCSNICRALNSYINRVYEVGLSDGSFVIAKFYRPGRWSRDALQDELDFLGELHEAEVPVVPPRPGADGACLHDAGHGTWFAVFPKKGGRPLDEPAMNEWPQLGRLFARMHAVGAAHAPRDRIVMAPRASTSAQIEFILRAGVVPASWIRPYEEAARGLVELIAPLFEGLENTRIHGDCHRGNILHRPGEGFHLIDFDDMAMGPPVQDVWMMLPGHLRDSQLELELLLEGYETFHTFSHASLRLIEPLRAMRFIHYTAWCARQKADGGFSRLAPEWGTPGFWRQEIEELQKQRQEVVDALEGA